jgi:hypothetical protein
MKPHVVFAASLACALAACSGTGGSAAPTVPPFGTDPAPSHGSESAGLGPEPGTSGPEPGTSGQEPIPVSEESIGGMCAGLCGRLATACGQGASLAKCASDCIREISAAGVCQPLYLDFLRCIQTATLVCNDTGGIALPDECYGSILALAQCEDGYPTPTGGASPTAPR